MELSEAISFEKLGKKGALVSEGLNNYWIDQMETTKLF